MQGALLLLLLLVLSLLLLLSLAPHRDSIAAPLGSPRGPWGDCIGKDKEKTTKRALLLVLLLRLLRYILSTFLLNTGVQEGHFNTLKGSRTFSHGFSPLFMGFQTFSHKFTDFHQGGLWEKRSLTVLEHEMH